MAATPKKKQRASSLRAAPLGKRRRSTSVRHTAPDAAPRKRAKKLRLVAPVAVVEPEMDPRDARDLARGRPQRHHGG